MTIARTLLLALGFGALGACGFQPVYAPSERAGLSASRIEIDEIPGRSGYMLRQALMRELAPGLPGVREGASLNIKLTEQLNRLTFTPDGAASRSTVIARGSYVLAFGDTKVSGDLDAETSFSVPDGPYGDISAQSSASDRAMGLLARRIADDLRLKLKTDAD